MAKALYFPEQPSEFTHIRKFPYGESKIKTQEFVAASADLVTLVEKLGGTFLSITHDMKLNLEKITSKFQEDPVGHQYLFDMIASEVEMGEVTITISVMWLRRELHFFNVFFEYMLRESASEGALLNLTEHVLNAYQYTLQEYHGWLGANIIRDMCRKFPPNRTNYMRILTKEKKDLELKVIVEWKAYNRQLDNCIQKLMKFYNEHYFETF